jgi:uncharacterized repeat protein (TIGR04138 family)
MSKQVEKSGKTIEHVAKELGRYPLAAFEFLRQGLDYTAQTRHGPLLPGLREVLTWLEDHGADVADLCGLAIKIKLPKAVREFLEQFEEVGEAARQLNRHVSGEELCRGLCDLALERWGLLAPLVLGHWGIRSTRDFGEMVFALVSNGLLRKQPEDTIADFDDVYDFEQVFDHGYKISLAKAAIAEQAME